MAVLQGNAKQGSVRGFYPKTIEGSLRFNDDDSAYLSWTPASAGNRKTWTWSGWVKRSNLATGIIQGLFEANDPSSTQIVAGIRFETDDRLKILDYTSGYTTEVKTTQVFRDTSSWYHIVVAYDTTQATASNRVKLYVNGVQVTDFSIATYPSQNSDGYINTTGGHYLGACIFVNVIEFLDGYLAEVHFTDGTAYTADAFGEFKNGVWVAKTPDVTYGTNGFYLDFQDDTEVEAFNTVLYRGNGATQSITGMGFEPDLVWIKNRSNAYNHRLYDKIRGNSRALQSNQTNAESTYGAMSFESDGFSFTNDPQQSHNTNGDSYVAWGWKAGDSNVSNTDGSITSTVRANDTYGFSIVSWDTPNPLTLHTVGHGLSSAPDFMIIKDRDGADSWIVYHQSVGSGSALILNQTTAAYASSNYFGDTDPTTSVFSVGTAAGIASAGDSMIAYCWAEKTGYSKFGSYTGGTANYKVTTDFRPSLVLVKRTDSTSDWQMFDGTRDVSNPVTARLNPNQSYAELTNGNFDILSDGFELNDTSAGWNVSGGTYIYAAFADTREAAFWLDQSGNDNDWQPVNLDHNDTVADSPTDNFATLNPLTGSTGLTYSDGNLKVDSSGSGTPWRHSVSTIAIGSGQWYWEATRTGTTAGIIAITDANSTTSTQDNDLDEMIGYRSNGTKYIGGSNTAYGASWTAGDVLRVALDMDAGTVTFYKNNDSQGSLSHSFDLVYADFISSDTSGWIVNFGQQPFKYDPPA